MLEKFGEAFQVKCAKKATEDTICMTHPTDDSPNSGKQYNFTYNYVFDDEDAQADVYEAVKELVDSTLDGHNATIFTYGQTGSGKTHTVLGSVESIGGKIAIGSKTGLFMRVLDDLIRYKAANAARTHVVITIAILEIYMESLKDLLAKGKTVDLQRNRHGDDAVPNLKLTEVCTLQDCFNVFQVGQANRSVAQTQMNDVSSRSHAVFMIDILQQEKTANNPNPPDPLEIYAADFGSTPAAAEAIPIKKSRLCLVDLAGSERLKKSGAEGKTLKETQAINASLACLGNVVNALFEGKGFVGYRDSKLTMLLKSSFERANAKILLITNISPITASFSESMGSLRFADRVMGLKAKQVFMLDADSEQDYLDSLRLHAELCADVRIAIASFDLHLYGRQKLKRLRSADGSFSKDVISKLNEEHKKQSEEQSRAKLEILVNKLISSRETIELQEKRRIDEQNLQLKCEEQDLQIQTLKNEELMIESGASLVKEEYKFLKKMTKNSDKAITAIKDECTKTDADLAAVEEECQALLRQIEANEKAFLSQKEEPASPLPVPVIVAPVVEAVPPPQTPASEPLGDLPKEKEKIPRRSSKRDDSSSDDERGASPVPVPRKISHGLTMPELKTATKAEIEVAAKAAASAAADLRRQREALWKQGEANSATVRQMALTAEIMSKDDDEEEEEFEEEDDGEGGTRLSETRTNTPKAPATITDRKRMKEVLKASGLKKSEIAKILDRLGK